MSRHSGHASDEELLTQLGAAFPVEQVEPDASSLHRLSLAVAELHPPAVAPAAKGRTTRRRTPRLSLPGKLSPVVSAGTLVGALVMGTGISYAVGVPIPAAVRSVARTVGLAAPAPPALSPVDAAQQAESTLHQALTDGDSTNSELSHDSSELAHKLAQVEGDHSPGAERVSDDGHHLLNEACRQMGGSPGSGRDSSHGGACDAGNGEGQRGSGSSPGGPSTGTPTTAPSNGGRDDGDHGDGGPGDGGDGNSGGDHGTNGGSGSGTSGRTGGGGDDSSTAPSGGPTTGGSSGGSASGGPSSGTSDGGGSSGSSGGHDSSGQSTSGGQSTTGSQSTSDGNSSAGGQTTQTTSTTSTTSTTLQSGGGSGGGHDTSGDGSSGGKG